MNSDPWYWYVTESGYVSDPDDFALDDELEIVENRIEEIIKCGGSEAELKKWHERHFHLMRIRLYRTNLKIVPEHIVRTAVEDAVARGMDEEQEIIWHIQTLVSRCYGVGPTGYLEDSVRVARRILSGELKPKPKFKLVE